MFGVKPQTAPRGPISGDWNWFWEDLAFAYVYTEGEVYELLSRTSTPSANVERVVTQHGVGVTHSGRVEPGFSPLQPGTGGVTLLSVANPSATGRETLICQRVASTAMHIELRAGDRKTSNSSGGTTTDQGSLFFICSDSGGGNNNGASDNGRAICDGGMHAFGCRRTDAGAPSIWRDGVDETDYATLNYQGAIDNSGTFVLGGLPGTTTINYTDSKLLDVGWNRALTDEQMAQIGADPFGWMRQGTFNEAVLVGVLWGLEVAGAPTALTATAISDVAIDLAWTAPAAVGSSAITGYRIERATGIAAFEVLVADTGTTTVSYSDTGLTALTLYTYRVSAINGSGVGPPSNSAFDTTDNVASPPDTVPDVPTDLVATVVSDTQIDLVWVAPADDGGQPITGYFIEVESPQGAGFSILVADTGTTDVTYSHTGLTSGTLYTYRVSAINSVGTGDPSLTDTQETAATTASTVPGAPTSLLATAPSAQRIELSWTAPTDDGGAPIDPEFPRDSLITGYRIERESPAGGGIVSTAAKRRSAQGLGIGSLTILPIANSSIDATDRRHVQGFYLPAGSNFTVLVADTGTTDTTYTDSGLSATTQYNYRVRAINSVGVSTPSVADDATTLAQSVGGAGRKKSMLLMGVG